MTISLAKRNAAIVAATLAGALGASGALAHGGPTTDQDRGRMMHEMEQVQQAGKAMREAPPAQRDQAMANHRQHMMKMMRMMHGGHDGDARGGGMGMGMKMGDDDTTPNMRQMRAMSDRMDMMQDMMSEMLDHMDMHERGDHHR